MWPIDGGILEISNQESWDILVTGYVLLHVHFTCIQATIILVGRSYCSRELAFVNSK